MASSRPLGRGNLAAILRTVLQASYEEQKYFSTLLACASVLLIEKSLLLIEELSLPSSNLSHRIRKVGFSPLGFFSSLLWTTISKTKTGSSSLINSISYATKICMVTLPPKAGTSVLPPERYPVLSCRHSGKQSITSLVLDLTTQPQVNGAGSVFLLNSAGWLRYLALTFCSAFTYGFKCTVITNSFPYWGNQIVSVGCHEIVHWPSLFASVVLGRLWEYSLSVLCNGHSALQESTMHCKKAKSQHPCGLAPSIQQ